MSVRTKLILLRVGCLMLLGAASVAYPAGSYLLFFLALVAFIVLFAIALDLGNRPGEVLLPLVVYGSYQGPGGQNVFFTVFVHCRTRQGISGDEVDRLKSEIAAAIGSELRGASIPSVVSKIRSIEAAASAKITSMGYQIENLKVSRAGIC